MLATSLSRGRPRLCDYCLWVHDPCAIPRWIVGSASERDFPGLSFRHPPHRGDRIRAYHRSTRTLPQAGYDVAESKSRDSYRGRGTRPSGRYVKPPEEQQKVRELHAAARSHDLDLVWSMYDELSSKRILAYNDLTVVLTSILRASAFAEGRFGDGFTRIVQRVTQDIQKHRFGGPLDLEICAMILQFYCESARYQQGLEFWNWLRNQDQVMLRNQAIYGFGLILMARTGSSTAEIDECYQKGLACLPYSFHAYHLSANSIVPDRAQDISLGFSWHLLAGAIEARLLCGDIAKAYMDLDSGLRLKPDGYSRWSMPFIKERSLAEAYTVFAIAFRGGLKMIRDGHEGLMSAFRGSALRSSPKRNICLLRGALSATYWYLGGGGTAKTSSISDIVLLMTGLVRLHGVSQLSPPVKESFVDEVVKMLRDALAVFELYGQEPSAAGYNSMMVNLGGFGQRRDVFELAVGMIRRPNMVSHRSAVTTAGLLKDKNLLISAWKGLVDARLERDATPDGTDLHVLVKAAHLTDQTEYASQQIEGLGEYLLPAERERLLSELGSAFDSEPPDSEPLDVEWLLAEMKKVKADLDVFRQLRVQSSNGESTSKTVPRMRSPPDLAHLPAPMTFVRPGRPILPEKEMRKLYDEYTTERKPATLPDAHETGSDQVEAEQTPPVRSTTNIPYDVLRYENWKSINYLLEESRMETAAYSAMLDQAMAENRLPPARKSFISPRPDSELESYGLSDAADALRSGFNEDEEAATYSEEEIRLGREKIKQLRGGLGFVADAESA